MRRIALLFLFCVTVTATAEAATYTAASCNYSDVVTAVGMAVDNDTVIIPAGTCTWTENTGQKLTVSGKGIKLRGDPSGVTTLISAGSTCSDNNAIINITEDASHPVELFDLTFRDGGGTCSGSSAWFVVEVRQVASGKPTLIHDNSCSGAACVRGFKFYVSRGVVYLNNFTATSWHGTGNDNNTRQFVSCAGGPAWNSLPTYGTSDANGTGMLYLEDNTVNGPTTFTDAFNSCRIVIRYNELSASHIGAHGLDSGGASSHSMRHGESYANNFHNLIDPGTGAVNSGFVAWHSMRGGSWRIFDNDMPDFSHGFGANAARLFSLSTNYGSVFWSCWGTASNPLHGTAGTNMFAGAQYPMPEQTALGWNGGSTGSNHTVASHPAGAPLPGYIIEGIYVWNNTGSDATRNSVVMGSNGTGCPSPDTHSQYIQQNRDWFNSAPAGYVACDAAYYPAAAGLTCEYPHKLRHDQTGQPPTDTTPPTLTTGLPGVAFDTTDSTGVASGTCTDSQNSCAATGTASNSLNSDTAVVTVTGTSWAMATIDYAIGLNPVTVTILDTQGNSGNTLFTVFREDCGSSLPYTNGFALFGDGTAWGTPGKCFTQFGAGARPAIVGNKLVSQSTAMTCEAFTGQILTANQSIQGTVSDMSGTSGVRLAGWMSGSTGSTTDTYAIIYQIAPTNTFIGRLNGAFGFDAVYQNYTGTFAGTPTNGTTGRLEIVSGVATAFIDIDGVGAGAEVQLSPSVTLSQSVPPNGVYPITNGPAGYCFTTNGRGLDDVVIDNEVPTPPDTVPPVVAITTPANGTVTEDVELAIGAMTGTCTDNTAPDRVAYENDRAPGFTSLNLSMGNWSNTSAITLLLGANNFTVRCHDAQNNFHDAFVTVTRAAPEQPEPPPRRVRMRRRGGS